MGKGERREGGDGYCLRASRLQGARERGNRTGRKRVGVRSGGGGGGQGLGSRSIEAWTAAIHGGEGVGMHKEGGEGSCDKAASASGLRASASREAGHWTSEVPVSEPNEISLLKSVRHGTRHSSQYDIPSESRILSLDAALPSRRKDTQPKEDKSSGFTN